MKLHPGSLTTVNYLCEASGSWKDSHLAFLTHQELENFIAKHDRYTLARVLKKLASYEASSLEPSLSELRKEISDEEETEQGEHGLRRSGQEHRSDSPEPQQHDQAGTEARDPEERNHDQGRAEGELLDDPAADLKNFVIKTDEFQVPEPVVQSLIDGVPHTKPPQDDLFGVSPADLEEDPDA